MTRLQTGMRRSSFATCTTLSCMPFFAACRMLLQVRTLRRAFWGAVVIGGGFVPLAVLLPLYLDQVYHLNEAARGLVVSNAY